jgi:peptidoglycan/LPS O-acetylase OafA/YrhL
MRGVAAILIAFHHFPFFFTANSQFFDWGWVNVDLFFLLSGIVITHVYEKRVETGQTTFTEFLSHRLARLWPMHVFAMASMLALDVAHHLLLGRHIMDWNASAYTLLLNLVLMQNLGLYGSTAFEGHTWDGNAWSLTPEIIANLVWFYFVARKRLSSKLLISVVLFFAVLQYNLGGSINGLILSSNLIRCTISYAMGCLLYRHFIANPALTPPSSLSSNVAGLGLLSLVVVIVIDQALWHTAIFHHWDWIMVLFIFPSITYFVLQPDTVLNYVLSSKLLVFLGTISYSVYLMHVQVGMIISFVIQHLFKTPNQTAPYSGMIFVMLVTGVATLTYRFVEVPSRKALRERLTPFLQKIFFDLY